MVRQKNTLPFETNVHLHGGYVPAQFDGHPMDIIPAGGTFDYHYPNDQDAATLWYHDHAHGRTSRTLYYGLVGMYIVQDELEEQLNLPRDEYEVPIILGDHAFNKDGSFRYEENVDLGFRGDTILVNGAISPRMAVERRKYRFRLLNGSNARSYTLRLGNGRPMLQIAGDGGLLSRPVTRTRIPFHPAERVEFVIDFSAYGPGEELVLNNADGLGGTVPILRFDVEGGRVSEDFTVPSRMRELERLPSANARRTWNLALGTAAWQINGLGFDPNRIDVRRAGGTSEIWTFVNKSNRVHPMHLHGFFFRVLERSSGPVAAGRPNGLEGHGRRAAERDGERPGVVRPLRRQVRVPLPLARTRRQGDDAADGDRVMRVRIAGLTVAAVLTFAGEAAAANQVQADDATLTWAPANVAVMPGESVTWTFTGTSQAHNVASNSANWTLSTPIQSNHAPVTYTFPDAGEYAFICQVHSGMTGTVYVNADGTVPGSPPPPPSEQPFPNDQAPPGTLEVADTSKPKLSRVHATRIARGVRVRFHLPSRDASRSACAGVITSCARGPCACGAPPLARFSCVGYWRVRIASRSARVTPH